MPKRGAAARSKGAGGRAVRRKAAAAVDVLSDIEDQDLSDAPPPPKQRRGAPGKRAAAADDSGSSDAGLSSEEEEDQQGETVLSSFTVEHRVPATALEIANAKRMKDWIHETHHHFWGMSFEDAEPEALRERGIVGGIASFYWVCPPSIFLRCLAPSLVLGIRQQRC